MADKTEDGGLWTGCAVLFLQSLCPNVNLLSLYKDHQNGKFMVFKVIKLTLTGKHSVGPVVFPVQEMRGLLCKFAARFCTWSEWIRNTEVPRCWSLSGSGGEVHGCGSVPAVPQQLQLWSFASIPLTARLQTSRSSPRTNSWNTAQGQHSHPGSLSGWSGTLLEAHPPVTGELPFPGSWPVDEKSHWCFFFLLKRHVVLLMLLTYSVVSISLSVFVMKRLTIWNRSCRARPSAWPDNSPTPTSRRSPLSPTTASNFRTESLVSQNDLYTVCQCRLSMYRAYIYLCF